MREIRQSGSEGGEPHPNAASLPLSGEMSRIRAFSHLTDPPSGVGGYGRNESTRQGTHCNRPNLSKDDRLTRCNDV
jgi:hypothetical protein